MFDRGRIVAHLRVWDRLIRVRGVGLRAGGVGSLLTHPDHRGRGYARALLAETEQYFTGAGFDLGLLFSIIGTRFYESQGWTPIPLPTFRFVPGPLDRTASVERSARALDVARDLDAVVEIYERCTGRMTGPEVRPGGYWALGPSRYRGVFPDWGAVRDGKVIA